MNNTLMGQLFGMLILLIAFYPHLTSAVTLTVFILLHMPPCVLFSHMFSISRPFMMPNLIPPKIPDGEKVDFDVSGRASASGFC